MKKSSAMCSVKNVIGNKLINIVVVLVLNYWLSCYQQDYLIDEEIEEETDYINCTNNKPANYPWCPADIPLDSLYWPQPTIYVITATYSRRTQVADLVRMGVTLRSVPNILWLVIEDASQLYPHIEDTLNRSCVHFVYLQSNDQQRGEKSLDKGNIARQTGVDWVWKNGRTNGVLYIGDDDNTYDINLFDIMRKVKSVGIWPAALLTGGRIEMPSLDENKRVNGWVTVSKAHRKYHVDMSAFALNLHWMRKFPKLKIGMCELNSVEACVIEQMQVDVKDLEVYGMQEKRVLVWHTKTWSWPGKGQNLYKQTFIV